MKDAAEEQRRAEIGFAIALDVIEHFGETFGMVDGITSFTISMPNRFAYISAYWFTAVRLARISWKDDEGYSVRLETNQSGKMVSAKNLTSSRLSECLDLVTSWVRGSDENGKFPPDDDDEPPYESEPSDFGEDVDDDDT